MKPYEKYKETNLFSGCIFKFKVFEIIHNQSVIRLHWHDYHEILYFAEGKATLNIGSFVYDANAGDIFFINSKQMHAANSKDGSQVRCYAIVIDPSVLLSDAGDACYRKYIIPFALGNHQFPVNIDRSSSCYKKVKCFLKTMISEYRTEKPGYEIKVKACLYSLIIELFRAYLPINRADTGNTGSTQEIKGIRNLIAHIYITGNLRITVGEAAGFVRLSPFYFCKVFKKVTGQTFIEFLNTYKINLAEEFLLYTPDTISNIASDLGFCNLAYFNKVFKQIKGCSPSSYRKQKDKGAIARY